MPFALCSIDNRQIVNRKSLCVPINFIVRRFGTYVPLSRIEKDLLKIALVGKRNDSAVYRQLARL
jgi:hypothetical protein